MYPSSNTVATQEALLSEKRLAAELATARESGSIPCPWQKKKRAGRREGTIPLSPAEVKGMREAIWTKQKKTSYEVH